jgi:hypothetical protein
MGKVAATSTRGSISTEYTVWCGLCAEWEQFACLRSKAQAAAEARREGWRHTKENGWICAAHYATRAPREAPTRARTR